MSNVKINQKEYLKKYLGGKDDTKKKKKKKSKVGLKRVKVIDDDVDVLKNIRPVDDNEFEIFNATEDAPSIVGVIDERGSIDFNNKKRWKIVADDGEGNIAISSYGQPSSSDNNSYSKVISNDYNGENNKHSLKESLLDRSKNRSTKKKRRKKSSSSSNSNSSSDSSDNEEEKSKRKHNHRETSPKQPKKLSKINPETDSNLNLPRASHKSKELITSTSKNESDLDLSPPRQSRKEQSRASKNNRDHDSNYNLSRKSEELKYSKNSRGHDSDFSPPRKSRKELQTSRRSKGSDSDLSPPRKSYKQSSKKRESSSDLSPARKYEDESKLSRKNRDSDLNSRKNHKNSSKLSTKNGQSDSDLSPPRKDHQKRLKSSGKNRESDSDCSPPRKNHQKHSKLSGKSRESDSNLSPPRKDDQKRLKTSGKSKESDSDLSPPRKDHQKHLKTFGKSRKSDSDLSPPRKNTEKEYKSRHNRGSESDLSPPRKSHGESSKDRSKHHRDQSRYSNYSRHSKKNSENSDKSSQRSNSDRRRSPERRASRWEKQRRSSSPQERMKKTLDGKAAGLQDAQALREETIAHKKREAELFNKMSAEVSGVGQAAVMRDRKTGRRRDLQAEASVRKEKEKRQHEIDEKYSRWGKGLKQVADQTEKLKDDLYEMTKPLARYADDADLDAQLRAAEREGDPMLEYIRKKQIKEGKREPEKPKYQGSFMPNRFGIKPGYRWDGVDRSNGYEKRWFEAQNARTAVQEEAYKWSTSDM